MKKNKIPRIDFMEESRGIMKMSTNLEENMDVE